jgi:putative endonuclease
VVTQRRQLGDAGEQMAFGKLILDGLVVLERNVRTPSGEIDIVARDGAEIAFIEVRTRRGEPGEAAESITKSKLARMWQCAEEYCEQNGIAFASARVDVVTVDLGVAGHGPVRIEHLRAVELPH